MPDEQTLIIWMISDGRPGHYNQTLGVIEAIGRHHRVELHRIETKLRAGLFRPLLKRACHQDRGLQPLCRIAYHPFTLPGPRPDMIISCGGQTLYLNIALARSTGAKNLFLGTLRGIDPAAFTAVISGLHLPGVKNLVELELSPGTFDHEKAQQAGRRFVKQHQLQGRTLWAMLIGGRGAGYDYTEDDIGQLLQLLRRVAEKRQISWLLTTSRRTDRAHERLIHDFVQRHPRCFAHTVFYHRAPEKVVMPYLGAAEAVVATEDSSSMISEAITARKPVISIQPRQSDPDRNYRRFLDKHSTSGRLLSLPTQAAIEQLPMIELNRFTPLEINLQQQIMQGIEPYLFN